MINSKKRQLVSVLILACICIPALATEPNEAKTKLKFEISVLRQQWLDRKKQLARGLIKPTHAAEFYINHTDIAISNQREIKMILETSSGQSISDRQQEFLKTSTTSCAIFSYDKAMKDHYHVRLYALSEDDARKMTEAFVEVATNKTKARMELWKDDLAKLQEKIPQLQKQISETEEKLKIVRASFEKFKKSTPSVQYASIKEAQQAISEYSKIIDPLTIELEGIGAKIRTIQEYQEKITSQDTLVKLEQMLIEQNVELAGVSAKRDFADSARIRARYFVEKKTELRNLEEDKGTLYNQRRNHQRELQHVEERLANPTPEMLPPKVYQNKVTIYPVLVEE